MGKNTKTIERTLTIPAQKIAAEYEALYGSLKAVLSAGITALSQLPKDEREKKIIASRYDTIKADDDVQKKEQPDTTRKAFKTVVKILSESGIEIKIADEKEAQQVQAVIDELGPELNEKPKHKTKTEVG
jgi:hypothetical protein